MNKYKIRLEAGTETVLETTVEWEHLPAYIFHDGFVYYQYEVIYGDALIYARAGNALQIQ